MKKTILMLLTACAFSVSAFAAPKITVDPHCVITETSVFAQTIVEERWTGRLITGETVSPNVNRTLWRIDCEKKTGICKAVSISLDHSEAGKPVSLGDVNLPIGVRLSTVIGKVATISWPQYVTITLDLGKRRLEYRSSSDRMEGVGYGPCD
jgi:hypothetical protein